MVSKTITTVRSGFAASNSRKSRNIMLGRNRNFIRKSTYTSRKMVRSSKPEVKQFTQALADAVGTSAAPKTIPADSDNVESAIIGGVGSNQRNGNKIFVKSITYTVIFQNTTGTTIGNTASILRTLMWIPSNRLDTTYTISPYHLSNVLQRPYDIDVVAKRYLDRIDLLNNLGTGTTAGVNYGTNLTGKSSFLVKFHTKVNKLWTFTSTTAVADWWLPRLTFLTDVGGVTAYSSVSIYYTDV